MAGLALCPEEHLLASGGLRSRGEGARALPPPTHPSPSVAGKGPLPGRSKGGSLHFSCGCGSTSAVPRRPRSASPKPLSRGVTRSPPCGL